jgi:hypothetical protein
VINQPFARDDGVAGGYRARLKSESIWEERSGGLRIRRRMVNILISQATIQDVRGMMAWSMDSGG